MIRYIPGVCASHSQEKDFYQCLPTSMSVGKGEYGSFAVMAGFVVVKSFNLFITLGDTVMNFLQALFLMVDFNTGFGAKLDTWAYGEAIIIACWVPALATVVHMIAHCR